LENHENIIFPVSPYDLNNFLFEFPCNISM
jgi:hypothetical protein